MSKETKDNLADLHKNDQPEPPEQKGSDDAWTQDATAEKKAANSGELNNKLKELEKKYAELEDQHKRLWADQQNINNRFQREKQDIHKFAAEKTIEAIMPALDNFEFAKKSINENTKHEDVIKSIDMLQAQLMMSLESVGLTFVNTTVPYDPNLHEAVSNVVDETKEEGTIIEVVKKGFKLKDKVIRPASVIVTTKK